MIRLLLLLTTVAFCTYCTEGRPPANTSGHQSIEKGTPDTPRPATKLPAVPAASSAQRAHVDPESGELTHRPASQADPEIKAMQPSALDAPAETLKEQPSPVPGGGVMIDLKGHFRSPVSATANGQPTAPMDHPADARPVESDHAKP